MNETLTRQDLIASEERIVGLIEMAIDISNQANINARESINPQLTPVMFELRKSIDGMEEKLRENGEKLNQHIENHEKDTIDLKKSLIKVQETQKEMAAAQKPVNEAYRNAQGATISIFKISGLVGAIGVILFTIKQLFKDFG